jgi:hypothetical protein
MGEWSEYFEDFPEENPANHDERGRLDPDRRLRSERERQQLANQKLDAVLRRKRISPVGQPAPVTRR